MNEPKKWQDHYAEAERLLAEGREVVREIRDVPRVADPQYAERRRDALGKKAMGIWAQAQVHATLATIRDLPDALAGAR